MQMLDILELRKNKAHLFPQGFCFVLVFLIGGYHGPVIEDHAFKVGPRGPRLLVYLSLLYKTNLLASIAK